MVGARLALNPASEGVGARAGMRGRTMELAAQDEGCEGGVGGSSATATSSVAPRENSVSCLSTGAALAAVGHGGSGGTDIGTH